MTSLINTMATQPTLAIINGKPTTTTRQVSEAFNKRHTDVLRALEKIECSKDFSGRNFALAEYLDEQGKPRKEYSMTRDGFVFLCMGFTGKEAAKWKEFYIGEFNRMETVLQNQTNAPASISKEQKGIIYQAVCKQNPDGKKRHAAWSKFNARFNVATYSDLPAHEYAAACEYLNISQKALPIKSNEEATKTALHQAYSIFVVSMSVLLNDDHKIMREYFPDDTITFTSISDMTQPIKRLLETFANRIANGKNNVIQGLSHSSNLSNLSNPAPTDIIEQLVSDITLRNVPIQKYIPLWAAVNQRMACNAGMPLLMG